MRRTELLQEIRTMRFEEVYAGWTERRLTQEEAARVLGVCKPLPIIKAGNGVRSIFLASFS